MLRTLLPMHNALAPATKFLGWAVRELCSFVKDPKYCRSSHIPRSQQEAIGSQICIEPVSSSPSTWPGECYIVPALGFRKDPVFPFGAGCHNIALAVSFIQRFEHHI